MAPAQQGHNGIDPNKLKPIISDIERLEGEMESKKGEYMAWCQRHRELINGHIDRAADAGIPKKELKAALKIRKLERRADKVREDLEPEAQETLDQIRHALGDLADLPLGQAAQGSAQKPDNGAETLNKLKTAPGSKLN